MMDSMKSLGTIVTPPHVCSYLPREFATMRYEFVEELSEVEYEILMHAGWRRFGFSVFHPKCEQCQGCRSLRVDVDQFRASQSQKRAWKANAKEVRLQIVTPTVTEEKLALYDRYHEFQSDHVGWRDKPPKDANDYAEAFVDNPIATQEWNYRLGDKLLGVGYVDELPSSLSAIYFFYDPDERQRSLGIFNVLSIIDRAKQLGKPYVYLGYYVKGCRSLEYKATFRPNQIHQPDGRWMDYIS
jgi:leucyl-tRNA---protein transferase